MRLDGDFVLGIETLLRAELAQEVEAGFPKLSRIPSAGIIKFLDYFAAWRRLNGVLLLMRWRVWGHCSSFQRRS